MRIDALTLFPEVMQPYLSASIVGRAQQAGLAEIVLHQLRDYSTDPHQKVDDRPFGGGPGMVLMCQPVCDAVAAVEALDSRPALRVLLTPQGRRFDQSAAQRYAGCERLLLICGHYEGFDERIIEMLRPEEVSLGDFVMTGGEIAALAVIDSVVRLLPGALGHEEAAQHESFQCGRLDYPQYTRPRDYRGLAAPDVLLSGNHAQIAAWRRQQAEQRTRERRPDLLSDSEGRSGGCDAQADRCAAFGGSCDAPGALRANSEPQTSKPSIRETHKHDYHSGHGASQGGGARWRLARKTESEALR